MRLYNIVLLLIGLALLGGIIAYSNPALLAAELAKSDMRFILAALTVSTIGAFTRVLKWSVLVGVGPRALFPVQVLGITISNFTPGKLAEPAKAVLLKMRHGVDVSRSLPSIIWERINDLFVLVLLAVLAIQSMTLESNFLYIGFLSIGVFSAMILLFLGVLKNEGFGRRLFQLARKFPLLNKISENFIETFYNNKIKKRTILVCFVITVMAWILEGYIFYFSLLAVGVEANPITLAGIIALAALIGVLSSLPGGLGSFEAVVILMLGITGITGPKAVAGLILFRFVSFWYFGFLGVLSFLYLSRRLDVKSAFK